MTSPILLVEDNRGDALLVRRALAATGIDQPLIICQTGDEALDYLFKQGKYKQAQRPYFILLDLNLPGTDGREVLQEIKQDDRLKSIPVVVLTTSNDEKDVKDCYLIGANSFLTKPYGFSSYLQLFDLLKKFWFEFAQLPNGC